MTYLAELTGHYREVRRRLGVVPIRPVVDRVEPAPPPPPAAPQTEEERIAAAARLARELLAQRCDQIAAVQRAVAQVYGVTVADLVGPRRLLRYVHPRQIAITLARLLTGRSLNQIAMRFGNRDRTTIMHAVDKYHAKVAAILAEEIHGR